MWREQAIIEWSLLLLAASVKLCALAARAFRLHQVQLYSYCTFNTGLKHVLERRTVRCSLQIHYVFETSKRTECVKKITVSTWTVMKCKKWPQLRHLKLFVSGVKRNFWPLRNLTYYCLLKVNFVVVSLNGVIFARTLDRKSKFHILNLIGQQKVNFLPLGQYSFYRAMKSIFHNYQLLVKIFFWYWWENVHYMILHFNSSTCWLACSVMSQDRLISQ